MAEESLISKVQNLSDLELATLICLIAQEHCIIDTEPDVIDDLVQELELVATKIFGLSHTVIDCSEHTTLEDFAHAILIAERDSTRSTSPARNRDSYFLQTNKFTSIARAPSEPTYTENKAIANVIIAKNLDKAPKQVQIQALELMKTKRIFTRTSVQTAPKRFLFVALLAGGEGPRLTKHLNDYIFISHFHDPEDGCPNLDELYDDASSVSSVVRRSPKLDFGEVVSPRISATDIETLAQLGNHVTVSVEVKQYQMNIISYLRTHRAVAGGITPVATTHFDKLVRCLAPLHDLAYATPSLIALAAKKIYMHRIHIVKPEKERSMQWGSDLEAVKELLEGIGAEDVLEGVLGSTGAEPPL